MTSSPDNNNIPLKNFLAKPRKDQGGRLLLYRRNRNCQHEPTFKPKPSVSAHGAKKAAPLRHPQLHKPNHHACPLGQQGDPVHGMIAQKKSSQMKK